MRPGLDPKAHTLGIVSLIHGPQIQNFSPEDKRQDWGPRTATGALLGTILRGGSSMWLSRAGHRMHSCLWVRGETTVPSTLH